MILRDFRARHFRALEDFEAGFGPGLNVVHGPNEAGKSTLHSAIVALLFAKPSLPPTTVPRVKSWYSEQLPVVSARITTEDGDFALTKDFEQRETELILPDGTSVTDAKKVLARVADMTRVEKEPVYLATACLRQQEWAQVSAADDVQELLQQSYTGGAEGMRAQTILNDLARATRDLERGVRRHAAVHPGPIALAMQERAIVEAELKEAREDADARERARVALEGAAEALRRIERDLANAGELATRVARYLDLDRKESDLRKQADDLGKRVGDTRRLEDEIQTLEQDLDEGPQVDPQLAADVASWVSRKREREDELAAAGEELQRLDNDRKRLEGELARLPEQVLSSGDIERCRRLRSETNQARAQAAEHAREAAEHGRQIAEGERRLAPRKYMIAAGVVLAIAGLGLIIVSPLAVALSVAGLIITAIGIYLHPPDGWEQLPDRLARAQALQEEQHARAQAAAAEAEQILCCADCDDIELLAETTAANERARIELAAKTENARSNVAVLQQQIDDKEAVVAALEGKLREALVTTGLDSVEQLAERAGAREKATRALRDRKQRLQGALGGDTREAIEQSHRELSTQLTGLQATLESPELATARMSPEQYQELRTKIDQLNRSRDTHEKAARQAEAQIAAARYDQDTVKELEGRRERLTQREQLLTERLEVWTVARDAIEEARNETLSAVTEAIAPRMGELLAKLTGSRYARVSLDSDLTPHVQAPEGDHDVPVELEMRSETGSLSCATREQVFLAGRLAIIDMLWPEGGPPLLLDDPLVNFDASRRQAAVEVIKLMAQTHQVILFTCSDNYSDVADVIVDMPGPNH